MFQLEGKPMSVRYWSTRTKYPLWNRGVDQRDNVQNHDVRDCQQSQRLHQRHPLVLTGPLVGRRVRQREAEGRHHQSADAGDDQDPLGLIGCRLFAEQKDERPRRDNPPDRAARTHESEFAGRVFQMRERDRIGHRDRRHINDGMDHEERKEQRKGRHLRGGDQADAGDQVTESKKPLGRKVAVGELIAEKDPQNRAEGKHAAAQTDLPDAEIKHPHVGENLGLPRAPDENLD